MIAPLSSADANTDRPLACTQVMGRASKTIAFACVMSVALSAAGCIRSHDSMVVFSDRIEEEADALLSSAKAESTISHTMETQAPWTLILVPRKGFDRDHAIGAGVSAELTEEILKRSQEWGAVALLVYAEPRLTSITKLADRVDAREQAVLHGQAGSIEVAVALARDRDSVSISSITARPR
jgi:hypothetical protein